MFDWNDLALLLAIARGRSLAAAARALDVNHSTVFRRINAFEAQIGVRLFERLPEGYVLTGEGEEIRRHAEQIEASVHALERTVAGRDFRLSGEIRLTTAPNLAEDYLPACLAEFRRRHPAIRVEVASGDHDFDLARREADLALRATTTPPEFLVGRRVVDVPWFAFASPRYLQRHGRPADTRALAQHEQIGAGDAFTRLTVFAWQRREFDARIVVRANDLNTMRALACQDLGVALLPADQSGPDLVRLFPLEPPQDAALWLLTHPDLRHVARIRALSDFLFERLRVDPRLAEFVPREARAPARKAGRPARRKR